MKNKKILKTLILLGIFSVGCGSGKSERIGFFDVSKDDKLIVFSIYANNEISIYQVDTNGNNLKKIVPASVDSNYFNPKFNKDG